MNHYASGTGPRVGFVLFIALVVLVTGLYVVAFKPSVVGDNVEYHTFFSETGGLRSGAPVWIGGVEVGSVSGVDFATQAQLAANKKGIKITLSVGRKYMHRICIDSYCRIKSRGLLGEQIVAIKAGSFDKEKIGEGGMIPAREGEDIAETIETLGAGVDKTAAAVVLTLEELRKMLSDIRAQRGILGKLIYSDEFYRDTFQRIDTVVKEVTDAIDQLSQRLDDEIVVFRSDATSAMKGIEKEFALSATDFRETAVELRQALKEANALMEAIRSGQGAAGMLVSDGAFADRTRLVVENLDKTLASLASIAEKVDTGEGSLGKFVNDASAYVSLRDIFDGVQQSWLLSSAVKSAEADGRTLRIKQAEDKSGDKGPDEEKSGEEMK